MALPLPTAASHPQPHLHAITAGGRRQACVSQYQKGRKDAENEMMTIKLMLGSQQLMLDQTACVGSF